MCFFSYSATASLSSTVLVDDFDLWLFFHMFGDLDLQRFDLDDHITIALLRSLEIDSCSRIDFKRLQRIVHLHGDIEQPLCTQLTTVNIRYADEPFIVWLWSSRSFTFFSYRAVLIFASVGSRDDFSYLPINLSAISGFFLQPRSLLAAKHFDQLFDIKNLRILNRLHLVFCS